MYCIYTEFTAAAVTHSCHKMYDSAQMSKSLTDNAKCVIEIAEEK